MKASSNTSSNTNLAIGFMLACVCLCICNIQILKVLAFCTVKYNLKFIDINRACWFDANWTSTCISQNKTMKRSVFHLLVYLLIFLPRFFFSFFESYTAIAMWFRVLEMWSHKKLKPLQSLGVFSYLQLFPIPTSWEFKQFSLVSLKHMWAIKPSFSDFAWHAIWTCTKHIVTASRPIITYFSLC